MNIRNKFLRVSNRININRDELKFYFDILKCEGEDFLLRGWIFSEKNALQSLTLIFSSQRQEKRIPLKLFRRVDVANAYGLDYDRCGFRVDVKYQSDHDVEIFLEYQSNAGKRKLFLIKGPSNSCDQSFAVYETRELTYDEFMSKYSVDQPVISEKVYQTEVDLIVPVYNGYEYLENLFSSIEKTEVAYRLFVIDDKSPDEKVLPFLREYAKNKKNVCLIENDENLGFVQSVNKALELTENHVAIVNTDVVLPRQWLERLMTPILEDASVASATPYTNSGTICSFPVFCENNALFLGMDVETIDRAFSHIRPCYEIMPTGVGFCMGMNKRAIREVGLLDAETFYKGYGEENDWCQRAIRKGYSNVHVENMFVWHKHGGSFLSEDKQRYIDRNLKLLAERYPNYHKDVAEYCAKDPNAQIREIVKLKLMLSAAEKSVVIFSHNWGGGANTYMDDRIRKMLADEICVVEIIDDAELGLYAKVFYQEQETRFFVNDYNELSGVIKELSCDDIVINELVSFEKVKEAQEFALRLKDTFHAKLTMLCHDFYAVCPSIYLINDQGKHCFKPNDMECERCYRSNSNKMNSEFDSIDRWRQIWSAFLEKCDEVITFSENTKQYYQQYYPSLKYKVVPHKVDYIRPVERYEKTNGMLTIGVIGNLMPSKGAEIVYGMADLIEKEGMNARIVVIGPDLDGNKRQNILVHGRYKREDLPDLMKKYQVDVVFIASIWPETFSYTTEEAIKMGMKVAAFNLGAPAERLKNYDKGIIIEEMTPEAALKKIVDNV